MTQFHIMDLMSNVWPPPGMQAGMNLTIGPNGLEISGGGPGGGNWGQSVIPFALPLGEDSVTVTGQTGITANSRIVATIYAHNDIVLAQDFLAPIISNIVPGVGFKITVRPTLGTFLSQVRVNWSWS